MSVAATVTSLTKVFRGGIRALDGLDFESRFGKITAVVGANGSGKSTLLRILCGALSADSGSVSVLECDPAQNSRGLRSQVAYVPQRTTLDPEMTGHEILALFCTLYGLAPDRQRHCIDRLTDAFELKEFIRRRVGTYSGGMRRRLHLAVGMVHEPQLLLLDEPSSDLDPDSRARLWQTLRSYADAGRALVVVTHDLQEVTQRCDRVCLLSRGKTRFDGTPGKIVAEHGRITLEISLDVAPKDGLPIRDDLAAIAGVEQVQVLNRQILLLLAMDADADVAVFDFLRRQSIGVEGYRQQQPNLASAYYHLTGQDIDLPPANGDSRRGSGKGGRGRQGGRR